MKSAVLLIAFNRPESTRAVFEAIRKARPPRLFVAADGPRASRPDDARNCRAVREIVAQVDWPCELATLFRDENLGCKRGVAGAIDWFFSIESEGIILEDDCRPLPGFFDYCDTLLARFRDDPRIAQICGSNFVGPPASDRSYFFGNHADIWGWAGWRRAWRLFDLAMADWPAWRNSGGLRRLAGSSPAFVEYWTGIFDAVHAGEIDTWDYQWMFACWRHGRLSVVPARSQIENIGWGANATHTLSQAPAYVRPPETLPLPLRHNDDVRADPATERRIAQLRYSLGGLSEAARLIRQIPVIGSLGAAIKRRWRARPERVG